MNITIVSPIYPPEIGGPASYVPTLAEKLYKNNKARVVTFCKQTPTSSSFPLVHIKTSGSSLSRQVRFFLLLFKNVGNSQVIYAQGTIAVGLVSLVVAKLKRKALVIKFVGDEIWESYRSTSKNSSSLEEFYTSKKPRGLLVNIHKFVLNHADAVVTPSIYLKNFLVKIHKVDSKKIHQINNPVEIKAISIQRKESQYIYVGRLVPWKNVDKVLISFAQVVKKQPLASLIIVGSGPEEKNLKKLARSLEVKPKVKFLGKLSKAETLKCIASSEILVLLSDYEGQSHTIIEAMCLGTKVVASNITPNRELLKKRGRLTDLKATSITEAMLHPKKISETVIKEVKAEHFWSTHIAKLEKVFSCIS